MTQTIGLLTFIPLEGLDGHLSGYRYFDDDRHIYVSKKIYESITDRQIQSLQFVTLSYRKNQKPIEEIVAEINEGVLTLQNGDTLDTVIDRVTEGQNRLNKPKIQVNRHKMTEK